jgi:hypothetical protein
VVVNTCATVVCGCATAGATRGSKDARRAPGKHTASRCGGDTIKLREPPQARATKQAWKHGCGRASSPGYGNNARDAWTICSQVRRDSTDAVNRLDGSGPSGLRYSRTTRETGVWLATCNRAVQCLHRVYFVHCVYCVQCLHGLCVQEIRHGRS